MVKNFPLILLTLLFWSTQASSQVLDLSLLIIKSTGSYLFGKLWESKSSIQIEGAPSWFYEQKDDDLDCESIFYRGDVSTIKEAEKAAIQGLVSRQKLRFSEVLNDTLEQRPNLDSQEKLLLMRLDDERDLESFVQSKRQITDIEHDKSSNPVGTYVRVCIEKKVLTDYHTRRTTRLSAEISKYSVGKSLELLDFYVDRLKSGDTSGKFSPLGNSSYEQSLNSLDEEISRMKGNNN